MASATYTYDAFGNRVRKDANGAWTEYLNFGGSTIAEKNSDGTWSDYIFANGSRVAKADTYDARLHIHGTNCSNCGAQYTVYNLPFSNYAIKNGDKLYLRQFQSGGGRGGLFLQFTDSTNANWNTYDQDNQQINNDQVVNRWHNRTIDLSAYAGKTLNVFALIADTPSLAGNWDIYYSDISIAGSDGTVTSLFARQSGVSATPTGTSGVTNRSFADERSNQPGDSVQGYTTTTYYHGDHLGSSRLMSAGGGWPTWQATYAPYGQQLAASQSDNHYQFTGDEHDAESGLEHTQFRQLNTVAGRWMSTDPYAGSMDIGNPQSLDRYSYVLANPLAFIDPDGLQCTARIQDPKNMLSANQLAAMKNEMQSIYDNANIDFEFSSDAADYNINLTGSPSDIGAKPNDLGYTVSTANGGVGNTSFVFLNSIASVGNNYQALDRIVCFSELELAVLEFTK